MVVHRLCDVRYSTSLSLHLRELTAPVSIDSREGHICEFLKRSATRFIKDLRPYLLLRGIYFGTGTQLKIRTMHSIPVRIRIVFHGWLYTFNVQNHIHESILLHETK